MSLTVSCATLAHNAHQPQFGIRIKERPIPVIFLDLPPLPPMPPPPNGGRGPNGSNGKGPRRRFPWLKALAYALPVSGMLFSGATMPGKLEAKSDARNLLDSRTFVVSTMEGDIQRQEAALLRAQLDAKNERLPDETRIRAEVETRVLPNEIARAKIEVAEERPFRNKAAAEFVTANETANANRNCLLANAAATGVLVRLFRRRKKA